MFGDFNNNTKIILHTFLVNFYIFVIIKYPKLWKSIGLRKLNLKRCMNIIIKTP